MSVHAREPASFRVCVHLGIRPLRISTGEEGKVYASTVGKNFSFECFLFPSQIFWVRSGRTAAERGPAKASAKKIPTERVGFPVRKRQLVQITELSEGKQWILQILLVKQWFLWNAPKLWRKPWEFHHLKWKVKLICMRIAASTYEHVCGGPVPNHATVPKIIFNYLISEDGRARSHKNIYFDETGPSI